MITRSRLKKLFHYNLETGVFTRLMSIGKTKVGDVAGNDHGSGYRRITIDGSPYFTHRLAFLYVEGKFPVEVDHISGDSSDHSWSNLRNVDHAENMKNMRRHNTNTSGFSGVHFNKERDSWDAAIYVNKKKKHVGRYKAKLAAVFARAAAEVEYGYHANHGR